METFGLFNLLENLLSAPAKPAEQPKNNDEASQKASPSTTQENNTMKSCQSFLERHERISHRIKR